MTYVYDNREQNNGMSQLLVYMYQLLFSVILRFIAKDNVTSFFPLFEIAII